MVVDSLLKEVDGGEEHFSSFFCFWEVISDSVLRPLNVEHDICTVVSM